MKMAHNENGNRLQRVIRAVVQGTACRGNSSEARGSKNRGGLVVGAPVYAELLAHPKASESFVNRFLEDTDIVVDFEFQQPVWLEAGRRFAR
jgi:hypothetical protein